MKLSSRIALTVMAAALVPLLLVGISVYLAQKSQTEQHLQQQLRQFGAMANDHIEDHLLEDYRDFMVIAGASSLRADAARAQVGLQYYLKAFPKYSSLILADEQGVVIAHAGELLLSPAEPAQAQALVGWVQEAAQGVAILDRFTPMPGEQARYLVFAQRIRDESGDRGWLFGQVNEETLAPIFNAVSIGNTGRITLFNRDGRLIGHHNKQRYGFDMSHYPIMQKPVREGVGDPGGLFVSGDGREKWGLTLMLDAPELRSLHWGIIVDQTTSELYAPVEELKNNFLFFGGLGGALFTLVAFWLGRSVLAPLVQIRSELKGFFSYLNRETVAPPLLKIDREDEFGDMMRSINANIATVEKHLDMERMIENEHARALEHLNKITNHIPGVVLQFRLRPDGRTSVPYASEGAFEIFRLHPEKVREDASAAFALVHPEDIDRHLASIQNSARDLTPWHDEYRLKFPDGAVRWLSGNGIPEREADGSTLWHSYLADITGQKLVAQLELERQARYHRIIDTSQDGFWVMDGEGQFLEVNDALCRMCGYTREELLNMNLSALEANETPEQIRQHMREISALGNMSFETRHRHKDGRLLDIAISVSCEKFDTEARFIVFARDVTARKQAEAALRMTHASVEAVSDMIFWTSQDGRLADANAAACRALGYSHEEITGLSAADIGLHICHETWPDIIAELAEAKTMTVECNILTRDGRSISAECVHNHVKIGERQFTCSVVRDITERKLMETQMRQAMAVFNFTNQAIFTTDAAGAITSVNPAFCRITGYTREEVIGNNPSMFKSGRHDAAFYRAMWTAILKEGIWEGEVWNRRANGQIFPLWQTISAVRDSYGKIIEFVALFTDITERKRQETAIWHQANFDALTGLANRNMFQDRLERALAQARRSEKKVGLIFLDLDRFKWINDTLGHDVGDELLIEVANRLKACVRDQDTVARLGGDEFTIVVHELSDAEDMRTVGEKAVNVLREPFTLAGTEQHISGSAGITIFPDDGKDVQTLLKNADIAMYQSKSSGRNRCQFFASHMQADALVRVQIENDLHAAIENRAFELYYQPIFEAASEKLAGAEALIRWHHPQRGMVAPNDFIPVAEDSGLITRIGEWTLREATSQQQRWRERGYPPLRISVNVSSVNFLSATLPGLVGGLLDEYGVAPGSLVMEVKESLLMGGNEMAEAHLREIAALGITYSLDDFGTGLSSLSCLKRFPIGIVKIDQSYIGECTDNSESAMLIEAIIKMAHGLGLKVTAEGVETPSQMDFLRGAGCDYLQGFLLGKPVPASELEKLFF